MSIITQLAQSFGIGKKTYASVVGVDIGSSAIKVVQLRLEKGKAVLETYGALALGPYGGGMIGNVVSLEKAKVVEAMKDLFREANVTAIRGGISIPYTASLTSVITIPMMSEEQVSRTVPLEARKYIPIPISDVSLDWYVIPRDEDQYQSEEKTIQKNIDVLLVAIRNDTLTSLQGIINSSGLEVSFYELEIFSAIRSSLGHGLAPVLVLDIGAGTTKISVIERGIVMASHTTNQGGQDMTLSISRALGWDFEHSEKMKREIGLRVISSMPESTVVRTAILSSLGRVVPEVQKVILEYGKRYQKNISKVLITGGGASVKDIVPFLRERVSVSDVELALPFAKVESPAFLTDVLAEVGPEFAVAVGCALRALHE